ncbi:DUF2971 domain-containing protein [Herbiconiux sp. UC225_62]|uniref:DUF2971 domain-containing protein n=1 Tax=Herbiconiux sp. UC225_62 TaxID=3350168 RepID=UPI0036D3F10D
MVPHLRQTESETVFHYTGGEGLLGIVSRGEIWASSYTVLNDLSEVKYGIDVVEQEVARRGEHIPAEFKDDFKNARSLILAHDLYLISASREGDLLNQWQGYAGLQGYAIEIEVDPSLDVLVPREAAHMLATSPTPLVPSSWYDVIYDPATQQRMTAETIEALIQILQRLDQPIPLQSKIIGAILAALVVRFKHPAFAAEQEVRFILSRHDAAIEEYRTSGNGTLIPYLRMAHAPMVPPGGRVDLRSECTVLQHRREQTSISDPRGRGWPVQRLGELSESSFRREVSASRWTQSTGQGVGCALLPLIRTAAALCPEWASGPVSARAARPDGVACSRSSSRLGLALMLGRPRRRTCGRGASRTVPAGSSTRRCLPRSEG